MIITLTAIALLLLISAIVLFLVAVTKKDLRLFYLSLAVVAICGITSLCAGFLFLKYSGNKVASTLKMRSGNEIYHALFGKDSGCVIVLNYQDQVIPVIDAEIRLQFSTCAAEVERILNVNKYELQKLPQNDARIFSDKGWFQPAKLGDSVLLFTWSKDNGKKIQELYLSTDSSQAFVRDLY